MATMSVNLTLASGRDLEVRSGDELVQGARSEYTVFGRGQNEIAVSGSVLGQYPIFLMGGGSTVLIASTGSVESRNNYTALHLDEADEIYSVDNRGLILGGGGIRAESEAAISNSGRIEATWYGVGAGADLHLVNSGVITTENSSSGNSDIVGVGIESNPFLSSAPQVTIKNTGSILGRDWGVLVYWNSEYADVQIVNTGVISGGQGSFAAARTGTDRVENHYLMSGDILLEGGNDVYLGVDGGIVEGEVYGGDGDDRLSGSVGNDLFYGGSGSDTLDGGAGDDVLNGGSGSDTAVFRHASGVVVDLRIVGAHDTHAGLDQLVSIENLSSGAGRDVLHGNAESNRLSGGDSADTLFGYQGDDTLDGGSGNDRLEGGVGNDTYVVAATGDIVVEVAGEGADQVNAAFTYTLGSEVENLLLTGSAAINGTGNGLGNRITGNEASNGLYGGAGNDNLYGGAGHDTLNGGTGIDRLEGGTGNDTYVLTAAGDKIVEAAGGGTDQVKAAVTVTLAAQVENLVLTGSAAINGTGNSLANSLTGNGASNSLNGADGTDRISGGKGGDFIIGGRGADVLTGGAGADDFVFTAAKESGLGNLRDTITDFAKGQDDIVLTSIDANTAVSGNQAFKLDAGGAFSAGEIRQMQKGANLLIELNLDADSSPEMTILLHHVTGPLGANDFLL